MNPIAEAVGRAVSFLGRTQSTDGFWYDFRTDVGISTNWVTGYVMTALGTARNAGLSCPGGPMERAARALRGTLLPGKGWGYNEQSQADADSTAWALLGLASAERHRDMLSDAILDRYQTSMGGFRTFVDIQSGSAWTHEHADVSAVVARSLLATGGARPAIERCLEYLLDVQRADGFWDAYWYLGSFYTTAHALRAFRDLDLLHMPILPAKIDIETVAAYENDPFQLALLGSLATILDRSQAVPITSRLIELQACDGRWISPPFMRVTDPTVESPWFDPFSSGPVISDQACAFTTATVVVALSELLR